ncbi:hypothetical protein HMPREF3222_01523 [Clostridium perfringens]|uniref:Uncharacterized protein n=2 Tax=Clostridium perfringens TaxID=1502 RepID=A0A133N6T3_CLOPF|nr:hypothetical protein HMPREF3222_01523 [Clostridium perfringens]
MFGFTLNNIRKEDKKMKNIDNYTSNKEARNKIIKESSEIVADEMRQLQEKEDEKKREESIKETSEKLASYMRDLEEK